MKNQEHNFLIGGMECPAFKIITNYTAYGNSNSSVMCPHGHSVVKNVDGYSFDKWVIPRALIVSNQGGFAEATTCLDCILEAEKTLRQ
jgi:hypothetical protein